MAQDFACDRCGYRPRRGDMHQVVLDTGLDASGELVFYVRCYDCGNEWVE